MIDRIDLQPVDRVQITTLYENLVDATATGSSSVERLRASAGSTVVSTLLAEERRNPFVEGVAVGYGALSVDQLGEKSHAGLSVRRVWPEPSAFIT